jgi:hypothetical protein
MTDYKATFEQWNDIEQWAKSGSYASTDHCILELLSRIESLEEETRQENICNNRCIQIIAERFDRLEEAIGKNNKSTSNLKEVRPSLVKRVAQAMVADQSEDLYKGEAKAAILAVAKWLREQAPQQAACQRIALALEVEVKR